MVRAARVSGAMTQVDAQMPISVTLAAEAWNGVLQILGEAPVP